MITTRPATPADFAALGMAQMPARVRALAIVADGRPVAVLGGVMDMPEGTTAAFVTLGAPAKGFAKSLHKAALAMFAEARRLGFRRVMAEADPDNAAAERWMRHFGFQPQPPIDGRTLWLLSLS